MIRISVPFHGSVPTNRTLSSTGPLSVQLKRSYRLHASIKAYFVGEKALGRWSCSRKAYYAITFERSIFRKIGKIKNDRCIAVNTLVSLLCDSNV